MRHRSSDPSILAVHRFGLGARPGERRSIRSDPRGWLEAQLRSFTKPSKRLSQQPSHPELYREHLRQRTRGEDQGARRWARTVYVEERIARFVHAVTTDQPFRERWVRLFSNLLCVSARKRTITFAVGAHEREAIRPHAVGRYESLLLASTKHPAMLVYLDNQQSVGPGSALGSAKGKGLNENLAREILELHTVGVSGGYTQTDVTELAKMLTGWTVRPPKEGVGDSETTFLYAKRRHQPGSKTFMGTVYPESGQQEGERALKRLAHHPSTARHIAHKIAVHFVADDPPEPIVADLAQCFRDTEGNLQAVGDSLIHDDRVWEEAARNPKLRTPEEVAIAMMRASGWQDRRSKVPETLISMEKAIQQMGQLPLSPPSPAGWPDRQEDWAGPEQILRRVELAEKTGALFGPQIRSPKAYADDLLGDRLHPETRQAIARAPDRSTAVALLLASPEFQWR
ncbi:MAG: hypothetical protein CL927_07800 [Deltaproteobacteria bacterium]|nr:hypothetical protein [Deltaproteobacteria bacterium]HCH62108.1 DUF1800 domain-containing protein [Deltaproteobacteria bacterium]